MYQSKAWPAPPSVLYKYRSLSKDSREFVRRIFTRNEVYFPSRTEFNDPFDCRPRFSADATKAEHRAYLDRLVAKRMPHLKTQERRAEIKKFLKARDQLLPSVVDAAARDLDEKLDKDIGIFCLSARPDHILMWSHYADAHSGLCLRFDAGQASPLQNARPVRYQSDYPVCNFATSSREDTINSMVYTKASEWAYEEEWRVHNADGGPGVKEFPPEILTGVIFGARIADVDRKAVCAWVRTRKTPCEFLQANLSKDQFRVEISPADQWREGPQ
jgi:hypothetical protein